jgi:hypothetical protein
VLVPLADRSPTKSLAQAAAAATAATGGVVADLEHAPPGARLGAVALVFGVAAVAVLCVPVLGYASVALSSLGLLLGLGGLMHQTVAPHGAGISGSAVLFPLAGTLVCLAALLLALLPFLLRLLLVQ